MFKNLAATKGRIIPVNLPPSTLQSDFLLAHKSLVDCFDVAPHSVQSSFKKYTATLENQFMNLKNS